MTTTTKKASGAYAHVDLSNVSVEDFLAKSISSGVTGNRMMWGYQDYAAGVITTTSVTLTANQNGTAAEFISANLINQAWIIRSDDNGYVNTSGIGGLFSRLVSVSAESGVSVTLNRIPGATVPCRIWYMFNSSAPFPTGYVLPPQNILDSAALIKLDPYFVTQDEIIDALTSTDATKVLSAAQGKALNDAIALRELPANKDATGGYVGLTLFKINFRNAANTITSFFTNSNATQRTYTFPDQSGTVALLVDLNTISASNIQTGNLPNAQLPTDMSVSDATFRVKGSSDATKKLAFEVDGFTSGQTRTVTPPNMSGNLVVQDSINLQLYGSNGTPINTASFPENTNLYYTDARVQTYVQGAALTYSQIQSFSKSIAANSGIGIQAQSIVGAFDIDATAYNTPGVYCNRSGQTISNAPSGMPTPLAVILWSFTDDINNNGGATSIVQYLYSCSSDTPYIYIRSKYSNHAKSAWVQISTSGVPVGTLIEYSANSVPTGFLFANGASVSRTTYAALFAVIGTTFGAGDGATTFQVPDARGLFLRGYGTNSNGWASGSFGTKIGDSFASHTHSVTDPGHTHAMTPAGHWYYSGTAGRIQNFYTTGYYAAEAAGSIVSATTGIAINSTGGTETAPKHIAVSICIKY